MPSHAHGMATNAQGSASGQVPFRRGKRDRLARRQRRPNNTAGGRVFKRNGCEMGSSVPNQSFGHK